MFPSGSDRHYWLGWYDALAGGNSAAYERAWRTAEGKRVTYTLPFNLPYTTYINGYGTDNPSGMWNSIVT